jgi:hypothetical protein
MTDSKPDQKPTLDKIADVIQQLEQYLPFLSPADSQLFYDYSLKIGKNILSAKSRGHFPEKILDFQEALRTVVQALSLLGHKNDFMPLPRQNQLAQDLERLKSSLENILELLARKE